MNKNPLRAPQKPIAGPYADNGINTHASGIDALQAVIKAGIAVVGCYPSGAAIASGEDYQQAFTTDPAEIQRLWNGEGDSAGRAKGQPIRLFRFIPQQAGIVVFDLDRGHADGADGIRGFYEYLKAQGKPLPSYLQSIEQHPARMDTPSGGLHLYFRTHKKGDTVSPFRNPGTPGIDLLAGTKPATAPGSSKPAGEYIFHGDLHQIPPLPVILERWITPPPKKRRIHFTTGKPETAPDPAKLMEWAIRDSGKGGRNNLCFEYALRAARYNYTMQDTIAHLQQSPDAGSLPEQEIITAVESAYKTQGRA